jgi:endonuclease/exonuclease/phosphatase family metal-dependent hydrolase
MTASTRSSSSPLSLSSIALPALVLTLGLQTLRIFIPTLGWYLRDTLGVGSATLGIYAFGTFLVGFLAPLVWRLPGSRTGLWVTAGGVALVRLAEQLIPQPAIALWLSMLGTALFLMFLPIFVGHARSLGGGATAARLAAGLALGLAFDTAIKGTSGTLDLNWISGLLPLLIVVVLVAAVVWLLARELYAAPGSSSETSWGRSLPLVGVGAFLLIEALFFQNQGWVAAVAQVDAPLAFGVVMLGNVLVVAGIAFGLGRPDSFRPVWAILAAVYLVAAVMLADQPGIGFLITLPISQLILGWALAALCRNSAMPKRRGLGPTSFNLNIGMLLFLLLAFAYYISLDIALPLPRTLMPPIAAAIVGLAVLGASLGKSDTAGVRPSMSAAWIVSAVLLLPPLLVMGLSIGRQPATKAPAGFPLKVMTYNIHSAYTSAGRQDPEAIAQTIEASGADLVTLQEVSRGWLLDGSTDLAAWLSNRLGMRVLFQGTTDPVWGNAILTRLPIFDHGMAPLPLAGTLLQRGYLWVHVDVGGPKPLLVIATHLHHIEAEHGPRLVQVPVLLRFWSGSPFTLLMGDMNSEPTYPEMDLIRNAGLIDSWAEAGSGAGLSWPAVKPIERIDWVWHTADLKASEATNPQSLASDHLPLVVVLQTSPAP